jgi:protein-S-isoprenylcysteine O-methyltransferase Ste14
MKLPDKPPLTPKHIKERLKLGAGGLQALALALFIGILIAPRLNASVVAPIWVQAAAFLVVGAAEISAFILLRYIPTAISPTETVP